MAIKDYDGTTKYEIGKLRDYDGTTKYDIGKVYDNDGTTDSLIYTAVDEIVIVPNSSQYPSGAFTKFQNTGSGSGSASLSVSSSALQMNSGLYNGYAMNIGYYVRVTINGQTKMDIVGSAAMQSGDTRYGSSFYVGLHNSLAYNSQILKGRQVYLKGGTSTSFNTTVDISGLSGTYYLCIKQEGCDLMNYSGYINLTKLRLYD